MSTTPVLGALPSAYEFRFDTGRICLDLLATAHPAERLDSVLGLRAWCAQAGLVPRGTALLAADPGWLTAFRELREHTGRLARAAVDGAAPVAGALDRVNSLARESPPAPRAVRGVDGSLVRALHAEPGCAALLAVLARDAVDLLTDPLSRARLRECAGDNCRLIYLDASRGRRRLWCSSEVCGNRERVARHRRRTASLGRAPYGDANGGDRPEGRSPAGRSRSW
ncbi:ABATE domain-containing protein [Streptomyces sp. NA04227]|uniref:CGNR zinc finger domain-containing protein n=1 Tax=Streptomyces sp. NA04227 TaxID=2742136 RepID=UPI001591E103|nr:ABATE domain-containing protein [Streptomyces sp. NA04227]QKW06795.1 ABATE domain-containing protein [Streptomyces sp. NA04227]